MRLLNKNNSFEIIFSDKEKQFLRISLLNWFQEYGRTWIPWKLKSDGSLPKPGEVIDPYPIWIAEVMLQQTQVKVVLPYWKKWMKTFPNLQDLANSDENNVLLLWQGLGYYSRARRLHQSSKLLLKSIGAKESLDPNAWPKDLDSWMALPGIGRTTAGSIISSAFDFPSPILDGNVQRIFARLIGLNSPPARNISKIWDLSFLLLDHENSRNFNQALMDLGSTVCTLHNPNCHSCPLKNNCFAYFIKKPTAFPVKEYKKQIPIQVIGVGIIFNDIGEVLIDQRCNDGLLGGLWEFPGGKQEKNEHIQTTIIREIKEELDIIIDVKEELIVVNHAYSHKKLQFHVYLCKLIHGTPKALASQQIKWVLPINLSKYPFPSANIKIIDALLSYLDK